MKKYNKPTTLKVALHTKPLMISASGEVSGLRSNNLEFTGSSDSREGDYWDDED